MLLEHHFILQAGDIASLEHECDALSASFPDARIVFRRFFLGDARQAEYIPEHEGAVSVIVQPPLGGQSVAVWIYLVENAGSVKFRRGMSAVCDCGAEHLWHSGFLSDKSGSERQTAAILTDYEHRLDSEGMNIVSNCLRTWFFCRDIDHNYAGLVKARREYFDEVGLLPTTHYIASTGIAGDPVDSRHIVQLDTWSFRGAVTQRYLHASDKMNPTYEYGVTFERGVMAHYSGKDHCIISGTASIDSKGNVLHVGDVKAQTYRMWENVGALLSEGGMSWENLSMALVYLRNPSDYETVAPMFASRFPKLQYVMLHAPVCRPDWLIEMECIAIK